MAHKHSVYDTDRHFIVDALTRAIIPQSTKAKLMQYDHNSERFTFQVPRYIDGHDMSLCNMIDIHYINLSSDKRYQSVGPYPVEDMQISPDSDDVIIFSWLISGNATVYSGTLNFAIRFQCITGDIVDYKWHTDTFSGISISSGTQNDGESIVLEYNDILIQWRNAIFGTANSAEQRIINVRDEAVRTIDGKIRELYESGVYVGSGEMPDGCNVQIDPEGGATPAGTENADCLIHVNKNGEWALLKLGAGLKIENGVLIVVGSATGDNTTSVIGDGVIGDMVIGA